MNDTCESYRCAYVNVLCWRLVMCECDNIVHMINITYPCCYQPANSEAYRPVLKTEVITEHHYCLALPTSYDAYLHYQFYNHIAITPSHYYQYNSKYSSNTNHLLRPVVKCRSVRKLTN